MQTFTSTIDTVYDAIISLSIRCITAIVHAYIPSRIPVSTISETVGVIEDETLEEKEDERPRTFKTMHQILKADMYLGVQAEKGVVMYASSATVPVYKNPTVAFDEQIGSIPYGEMVMMLEPKGRFFHVVWNTIDGWVLREDLVDRAAHVYPEFMIGQEHSVDHPNTACVRSIIGDVFGISRSDFALQAGEYVLYRLWRRGIRITWPDVRPRVPGLWHKILKGLSGVRIGVVPRVGSIMEYVFDDGVGHVAYVEAVFPDNTITISEANYPDSGIYNERVLTKEEWRELRPVFIAVQQ